ncbi:hypothetical protein ONA24_06630 [Mycoplasmopsis cynos]|uniref:hypothetical protein n=1 Tax=Mycoplasmopsis cynos TaxID=171284 RepID=UPI0024C9A2FF|nr:hypothetical protein [Mycoplasmopsis cynos]WAM09618.1 hypothetical protein ONA24_06630 [Mycoplasmopsis cynos]
MTKKLKNFIKFGGILCALSAATSIPLLSILISKSKSGIKETVDVILISNYFKAVWQNRQFLFKKETRIDRFFNRQF